VADAETVDLELVLADHALVERRIERGAKLARTGNKAAAAEGPVLERLLAHLDEGSPARTFGEALPPDLDL
jgi:ribosome-binding ATPase YchF (GTP1/OBG family)